MKISGDPSIARDIERLFGKLDPDWQQPLAAVFGDTLGYQIETGINQGINEIRNAIRESFHMAGEWLREEPGVAVTSEELKGFSESVDSVSDAVDRLEARIRMLRKRQP